MSTVASLYNDGDRVIVGGARMATVRYVGTLHTKPNRPLWIGVELDSPGMAWREGSESAHVYVHVI
jgi:dynactin complex subunit